MLAEDCTLCLLETQQVLEVSSASHFLPGFKPQLNLASLSQNRDLEATASNAAV